MMLSGAGARGMAMLLDVANRGAPMMSKTASLVAYVQLRAAYDVAHRRLDRLAEAVASVAAALNTSLERDLSMPLRWPTLEDLMGAQHELRRLRREMDQPWRDIPDNLRAVLVSPPHEDAKRLPRG